MMLRLRPTSAASTTQLAIVALVLWQGLPARAQEGVPGTNAQQLPKGNQAPLDINKPAAAPEKPQAPIEDGPIYRVSTFDLRYRTEHKDHPAIQSIGEARVKLGVLPSGAYVQYREGLPSVTIRVADVVEGTPTTFHLSAVIAVAKAIVADFSARGYSGVSVQIDPQDIDNKSWQDLRPPERSTLRMILWTGKAARVNTLALGPRLGADKAKGDQVAARYDNPDPVHRRIRAQSPVQVGDLLNVGEVDDFVARLNRHPGRSVQAQQSPLEGPDDPEAAELTYSIYEAKSWSAYAQLSNTGTKQTDQWRERFGFVHNQLTSHDDILRVDFVTGGFGDTFALTGSYEFPLLSDRISARLFGTYSEFSASQVGLAGESFGGKTAQGGAEVTGLIYQHRNWFVDAVGGGRWQRVSVTDTLLGSQGDADFFIPYLGARVERNSLARNTSGGVSFETNLTSVDQASLDQLGRFDTDSHWLLMKYDFSHSELIGPAWGIGDSLAHEVGVRIRGQEAFGARLIPNEQDVVGGAYTVRGYPESASAGDSTIVASFEYKYHLPRGFAPGEPGTLFGSTPLATRSKWFGDYFSDFRYQPQEPMGMTDWDLIFTGFLDVGRTTKSNKLVGESDHTLSSIGVGAEYQIRNNVSVKLDWGFALSDVKDGANNISVGDSRIHAMFTLLY